MQMDGSYMNIDGKVLQKNGVRTYDKKLWLGNESLKNKTIFIYPEQGHGDFIQCYRYIALLKKMRPRK